MSDINRIFITGNLTVDGDLITVRNGSILKLRVASNHSYRNGEQWEEEVCFIDLEAYGSLATRYASSMKKGVKITVEGRLRRSEWRDEKTQTKRAKLYIHVYEMFLLDRPPSSTDGARSITGANPAAPVKVSSSTTVNEMLARSAGFGDTPSDDTPFV